MVGLALNGITSLISVPLRLIFGLGTIFVSSDSSRQLAEGFAAWSVEWSDLAFKTTWRFISTISILKSRQLSDQGCQSDQSKTADCNLEDRSLPNGRYVFGYCWSSTKRCLTDLSG
jgi:hypothetical protein